MSKIHLIIKKEYTERVMKKSFILLTFLTPVAFVAIMLLPSIIMQNTIEQVDIIGDAPILMIFLNEKSRPSENNRNITPMSPHVLILPLSITDMV